MTRRSLLGPAFLSFVALSACGQSDGMTSVLPADAPPQMARHTSGTPDPTVTWMLPLDDATLAFRSDGRFVAGANSAYANGVCGVTTWVELASNDPYPGFAHATLGSDKKGHCARSFTVVYPDGTEEEATAAVQRGLAIPAIGIGETVDRTLALLPAGPRSRCGRVLFGEGSQGAGAGSDSVRVTRVDQKTWHVYSGTSNQALCENTGQLFAMPVDFVIVADDPTRF